MRDSLHEQLGILIAAACKFDLRFFLWLSAALLAKMKLAVFFFIVLLTQAVKIRKRPHRDNEQVWSGEDNIIIINNNQVENVVKITANRGFDFTGTLKSSFTLHAALINPDQSVVCSPVSALLPLGKLVLGTERGSCRNELLTAIGASTNQVKSLFRSLLTRLKYLPGVTLSVASRIFVSKNARLNKKYIQLTTSVFKSSIQHLDFSAPSTSAGIVNRWVSDQTRGKIPTILSSSQISPDASLLLVNVVYFGGLWKHTFKKVALDTFHTPQGQRQIPMMTREGHYKYSSNEDLGVEIVEIPYAGHSASFVIVLPDEQSGLTLLLRKLKVAPGLLNKAMDDMDTITIRLSIPKFKIESQLNLKDLYQKIGLSDIFNPSQSGLKRMVNDETVYVTTALQKCVIEVSQAGTEAAASSVLDVVPVSMPPRVTINRPFLFFVKTNEEQLFAGIFTGHGL